MSFYPKEFKEAISRLPSKEKDKLILRLLKKDLDLANRLLFELVDTRNVEELRTIIENEIISYIKIVSERFHSISYLNMDIRDSSGKIAHHVKITKDKYGDISLNLVLLNEVLKRNKNNILTARPPRKLHKFSVAIIARIFKVLLLINKMDDDLMLDFKGNLIILGNLILDNKVMMNTAIKNGLDINWLLNTELPYDIVNIHKNLRGNGFLR